MGDCIGKGLGFMKDGKFDKDTALKSVNTAFAGNAEWIPVSSAAKLFNFFFNFDSFRSQQKLSMTAYLSVSV